MSARLQFFPDPALGLVEFRRVLRLGGCAAACVISTPDRAPMAGILADVISRFLPQQRQILYLSFALADPKRLEHLLTSAGFRDIRVERETREYVVESFDDYWAPIEAGVGSRSRRCLAQRFRSKARGGCEPVHTAAVSGERILPGR
jgi:hypothetical protein